jgi:hypothetical protein
MMWSLLAGHSVSSLTTCGKCSRGSDGPTSHWTLTSTGYSRKCYAWGVIRRRDYGPREAEGCTGLQQDPVRGWEELLHDLMGVTGYCEDGTLPQIPLWTRIPPAYRPLHPDITS